VNICTIIAKNYLAHARVLADSFQTQHADGRCYVLVIDETEGFIDPAEESFVLVRPDDISLPEFDEMRGAYDVMELSTAVKPWLLRYMLENHDDGTGVAYMDPDIQVVSRMVELEEALLEHAVVLTPHVLKGMPRDGKKPSETDILMAGVYNLGFIGLSRRDDAHLLLDWWSERLLTDCHVAPERGLFVDQRWIDFVPGLISDLEIFRHPAYNVAYWNLPERELDLNGDGYHVGGHPLRFFHYSGYSPEHRRLMSKHQDRVDITSSDALWTICSAYGDALEAAGFHTVRTYPYEHDVLPSGVRLTREMRALYRAAIERGDGPPSLFTPSGETAFLRWLNEPATEAPRLSRLLYAIWAGRGDLRRVYPAVEDRDVDGYLGWCAAFGREQIDIPDDLIPEAYLGSKAPGPQAAPHPSAAPIALERPFGVNVAGYLRSELGIGEVARQVISALDAAEIPALPVGLVAPNSRQGHGYVTSGQERNPFPINLVCVNADGLPGFAKEAGERFFADRYTIGMWWWETSRFPEQYMDAFDHVDEVWVGSRFIAETLQAVSPVPVIHVPIPACFPDAKALEPAELGWPDAFTFLFSWDYNSVFARKNPLAVVEAYKAAFTGDEGTALVLKCINVTADPVGHRAVQRAIADRRDIVLMDTYLDPGDKDRLMASCDCYVSLHRSEGLGLTMAEAMYHGRPVVATGYSGNTDFMDASNSFLVGYELVPIGKDAGPYPADGTWAEPDLREAAQLLRQVFVDRDEAARRAAKAAKDLRAGYSADAAGKAMRRRLEQLAARIPGGPDPAPDATLDTEGLQEARRLASRGVRPDRPSRFGKPGGAVRRLSLRVMKPYTAYQQQVNAALERSAEALAEQAEAAAERSRIETAQVDLRLAKVEAAALAQLRRQQQRIDSLAAALTLLRPAERLVAESRAIPFMASDVFRVFDVEAAGSVLGYETPLDAGDDDGYRAFEDLFRGSEAFIADRQQRYLELIKDSGPAVDVGCGRGEFLDLLADAGIEATGVDSDAGMVARCHAKGHVKTVLGDAGAYLKSLQDASLGLIFAAQVVEHLPPADLTRFLEVAAAKLQPGGLLIAETVNPHSVAAMKVFWVDITHQHPLFPESLLALVRIAGFNSGYVFHPNGAGDVRADRFTTGEYAVVARR
jgi:glycosyltransferase involved in cell wall biosynthesis/2-polyprenyl-3-methyl-5-hydroxy-6-metoxy-1,4-benzoquinol methylase